MVYVISLETGGIRSELLFYNSQVEQKINCEYYCEYYCDVGCL